MIREERRKEGGSSLDRVGMEEEYILWKAYRGEETSYRRGIRCVSREDRPGEGSKEST